VVAHLVPAAPGLLVDATVGLAGHATALLQAEAGFTLLGLDRDPSALRHAGTRLEACGDRIRLVNRPFSDLPHVLSETGSPAPAAILADLGCSSMQLDSPERGFSFLHDGPLDMRMSSTGRTAAELLDQTGEEELMRILWGYGEERRARAITRAIVARRAHRPLVTTSDLVSVVLEVLGPPRRDRIHPATRTFQAVRIAVNDELGELERFVEPAARCLAPGGRLAIISFHSLEDRIVKHTLRRLEGRCTCPPGLPRCVCNPRRVVEVLTRRPERPCDDEVRANPRARSARLRVAQRVADLPGEATTGGRPGPGERS
jgi:16S rRNA (cytosine1402-N4)-methyltransferase